MLNSTRYQSIPYSETLTRTPDAAPYVDVAQMSEVQPGRNPMGSKTAGYDWLKKISAETCHATFSPEPTVLKDTNTACKLHVIAAKHARGSV